MASKDSAERQPRGGQGTGPALFAMTLRRLRKVWLVTATMGLAACAPQNAQDTAPSSSSTTAASTTVVEDTSTLPDLPLPGASANEPAGERGWTGALGSTAGMHHIIADNNSIDEFRATQLVFAVENDCFGEGGDPVPLRAAGLDGLYVEPYEDSSMMYNAPRGGETMGAYALPIGDRTLCVYLTWDPATTEEELASARRIVESIRGQPHGEDGIRINFTVPALWDIG